MGGAQKPVVVDCARKLEGPWPVRSAWFANGCGECSWDVHVCAMCEEEWGCGTLGPSLQAAAGEIVLKCSFGCCFSDKYPSVHPPGAKEGPASFPS